MENIEHIKRATPYRDINDVLYFLADGIQRIFGDDLIGLYLTGSLSYGDFVEGRSDIDLAVVLKISVAADVVEAIKKLHLDAGRVSDKWSKRLECSYISLDVLSSILPPKEPRPYVGEGKFYPAAPYGNEWLINKFFLCKYGIALIGPEFKTLVEPINIKDVQQACVRDLYREWEPKITDAAYLENSHYQSYVVLNLCRILYAVMYGDAVSKTVAVLWTKKEYPQWKTLIETAASWRYGKEMKQQKEVIEFIKFAIAKIKEQKIK